METLRKIDELTAKFAEPPSLTHSLIREAGLVEMITIMDPYGFPQKFMNVDVTTMEVRLLRVLQQLSIY